MSAKKDNLVNIGGWLAVNDEDLFEELRNLVVVYEGLHTYGGLAGRDMEALAIGIEESMQDDHIRARIGQVRYLGELLTDWDVPIVQPVGGHAVFLDARRFYPHLAAGRSSRPRRSPRSSTSTAASARWSAASSRPGATRRPATTTARSSSSMRLTIPRRVYTQAHMDVVAESVKALLRRPRRGARPADGLRAEVPALLPGALRTHLVAALGSTCQFRTGLFVV